MFSYMEIFVKNFLENFHTKRIKILLEAFFFEILSSGNISDDVCIKISKKKTVLSVTKIGIKLAMDVYIHKYT